MKIKALIIAASIFVSVPAPVAYAEGVPTFDAVQLLNKLKDFQHWIEQKAMMVTDKINQADQLVLAHTADIRDTLREVREVDQAVRDIINYEHWVEEYGWNATQHDWWEDEYGWREENNVTFTETYKKLLEEIRSLQEVIGPDILAAVNTEIDRGASGSTEFSKILLAMNPENPAYTELVDQYLFDTNGFAEMDDAAINAKFAEWELDDESAKALLAEQLRISSARHAQYRDNIQYASSVQQRVEQWEEDLNTELEGLKALGDNSLVASVQATGAIQAKQTQILLELLRTQAATLGGDAKSDIANNSDFYVNRVRDEQQKDMARKAMMPK